MVVVSRWTDKRDSSRHEQESHPFSKQALSNGVTESIKRDSERQFTGPTVVRQPSMRRCCVCFFV
jgi:hypothetical protein